MNHDPVQFTRPYYQAVRERGCAAERRVCRMTSQASHTKAHGE